MSISRRLFLAGAAAGTGLCTTAFSEVSSTTASTVTNYFVDGVAVQHHQPTTPNGKPSIVMVHGGMHGSWVFERYAPYFAGLGWDVHVLDWYNHGNSAAQAQNLFIKRSITDLNREIQSVTRQLSSFHLLGHSMGGLAALFCGTFLKAKTLVLLTPVVPSQVGAATVPLTVDLSTLFPVPSFTDAKSWFYQTMSTTEAQPHYARLQPESSQAVWESSRWTVSLNLNTITMPILCIGAGADTIVPAQYVQQLSTMLSNSEYAQYPIGHCDLLLKNQDWSTPAARVATFLNAH
jgi:pimeloyl-ACP methyl ester carboxylesterase